MRFHKTKSILTITAVILIASATAVLAQGRWDYRGPMGPGNAMGYDSHMGYNPRMGYGPGDRGPGRGGYAADLTDEQRKAMDDAKDKFVKETEPLRIQIRDKRLALNDTLRTENPDKDKVLALQKELSDLEGQFDQLAVQHRLEMQKLLPDNYTGRGFGQRGARGFNPGACRR